MKRENRLLFLPWVLLFFSCASTPKPQLSTVFSSEAEALKIMRNLIRIDTSNPPGNEILAAKYLKKIFDEAGIDSKIYESAPGRGNIIARIKGDGSKRPLLLAGHLDVVGVERENWTLDPFGAVIQDGRVYGRGTADMKGIIAAQIEAMLLIKRSSQILRRDIIFAGVADEESGGRQGMKYLVDNHWQEIDAEFSFNEGGRGRPYLKGEKVQWVGIQTTERRSLNLRIVAKGKSGHSMLQTPDNAIYALAQALEKLSRFRSPFQMDPTVERYVREVGKLENRPKDWYKAVERGNDLEAQAMYSMLHTTISPTFIKGGFRFNVIPAEAEAIVNCRLLPNVETSEFLMQIKTLLADPKISVEYTDIGSPAVPTSSTDTDAFRAFENVVKKTWGSDVPTIPMMGAGATDSRYLRAKGMPSYGIIPFSDHRSPNVHGHDESVSLHGFNEGVKFYAELVRAIAL